MGYFPAVLLALTFFLSACQPGDPACPADSIKYLPNPSSLQSPIQINSAIQAPEIVAIKGQEIEVNQVVKGTLCDGSWKGTVYVPCEIQIYEWEENPTFLENCDLTIEPGTVVYVAAHNDEPYYQGCSCHTGD